MKNDVFFFRRRLRINILLVLTVILSFLPVTLKAETVSRKEASAIAQLFFNAARGQVMAAPKFSFTGREFTTNRLFIPFYVFNHPTGGFVIISAENKAYPILAYSLTGKLEAGKLSAGQKALFNIYGRHIEFIRYDSSVPEEAIQAWGDIKHHIASILHKQRDVTDLLIPWTEVKTEIDRLHTRADYKELESVNYLPRQWDMMLTEQLQKEGNVVLGISNPQGELIPAAATGCQDSFFRLRFSEQASDDMYRMFPTELISQGEVAILSNPIGIVEPTVTEELPFSFYDSFINEQRYETLQLRAAIDNVLSPTTPIVQWQGSGLFSVSLPENVERAIIYNVSGMMVQEHKYRNTNMAELDITAQPPGFYIALLKGESGRPYTLRLYR